MGLKTALRAFSAALFDREASERIDAALSGREEAEASPTPAKLPEPPQAPIPPRSEAITLMATLQREARLIDLIFEDLSAYQDAQVGAAARPCLQQCRQTLQRVLSPQKLVDAEDGSTIELGESPSPTRYQRIGEGGGTSAKLVHHGWQAGDVRLPEWTGDAADAKVIAPAQVES